MKQSKTVKNDSNYFSLFSPHGTLKGQKKKKKKEKSIMKL